MNYCELCRVRDDEVRKLTRLLDAAHKRVEQLEMAILRCAETETAVRSQAHAAIREMAKPLPGGEWTGLVDDAVNRAMADNLEMQSKLSAIARIARECRIDHNDASPGLKSILDLAILPETSPTDEVVQGIGRSATFSVAQANSCK